MQFAGVDPSSPPVIDIPRQCMELLDLEKPRPDACAQPRLGQVAEQEFGLEDAAQVPVGRGRSDSWRCKRRGEENFLEKWLHLRSSFQFETFFMDFATCSKEGRGPNEDGLV